MLEIHPHDAGQRGIEDGDFVSLQSRKGGTTMRAVVTERMQPGVVYTTFHHPEPGSNVVITENSDWATNCPEYKVTAVHGQGAAALRVAAPIPRAERAAAWPVTRRDDCGALTAMTREVVQ